MASNETGVELGFVEKTEDWRLLSPFFPHKIGGKPAWLALHPLPSLEDLKCQNCGKTCCFLLQVYAPIIEKPTCFHRTLFVFICPDPKCCLKNDNRNFVVLRSQLRVINTFYQSEPTKEDSFDVKSDFPSAEKYQSLCIVCGGAGSKRCALCHKASYCGKDHQTVDWKGGHKKKCKEEDYDGSTSVNNFLFPEFEILTEPEYLENVAQKEKTDEERMAEYDKFVESGVAPSELAGKASEQELEKMASGLKEDKQFKLFRKRIENDPEQVVRYQRGGIPLWVSDENIAKGSDVPDCPCGAKRQFEFQILPQLLIHLDVDRLGDSIDWGTLAGYTCTESCGDGQVYKQEFLWKQDYSDDKSP